MDTPTATDPGSKPTKLLAAAVVGFGLFHCSSLLLAMLPRDSRINQILAPYRQLTGTDQEWMMFHTIATMQGNEIAVEVRDRSGRVSTHGPLLPGLRPYRTHSRIRFYYLLNWLTAADGPYLAAYLEKLRREIAATVEGEPLEFSVVIGGDYIRLLKRIEEDGRVTVRQSRTLGPFVVEAR